MTTPTPGSAGTPDRDDPTREDPTREIEVDHPTDVLPGAADAEAPEVVPTIAAPTSAAPVEAAPTQAVPTGSVHGVTGAAAGSVPAPGRPSGPHLPPVLLGLVCLAIAGLAIWQEVTDVRVDWGNVGPLGIVAIGALLVVLGLVGLLGSRHRSST